MSNSTTSSRYLTLSDNDHGAYLWIAVLLSFGFTTVTSATRLAVRRGDLWRDDWTLLAAQVCKTKAIAAN